ncbi:hypothetical protein PHMEG_00015605 [Phytophthora megakarya]|uniref:Uncharacterized protein n=1 Tax=Phytophthora megakarya TaxID=4795 RepID=A0A225W2E3_9STRA|nr:hypothetical protein PHMEG_00015605 [Phytophthora megakarya]
MHLANLFQTASAFATSNNPVETFSAKIKHVYTLRQRMKMGLLLQQLARCCNEESLFGEGSFLYSDGSLRLAGVPPMSAVLVPKHSQKSRPFQIQFVTKLPTEGELPRDADLTLFEREQRVYEKLFSEQLPPMDRREHPTPKHIVTKGIEGSDSSEAPWVDSTVETEPIIDTEDRSAKPETNRNGSDAEDDEGGEPTEDWERKLDTAYVSVMHEIGEDVMEGQEHDAFEQVPNEMELTDYAHELAFLPYLT